MPPPLSGQSYSDHLRALQHALSSAPQQEEGCTTHKYDYVVALRKHFNSLPPANISRRWTLDELCNILPGRYANKPAPRFIAAALRELGFTEHRDWTHAGRNRRYWMPSQNLTFKKD